MIDSVFQSVHFQGCQSNGSFKPYRKEGRQMTEGNLSFRRGPFKVRNGVLSMKMNDSAGRSV